MKNAKRAATSLLLNDSALADQVRAIEEGEHDSVSRKVAMIDLLREVKGTWTLTLVADAAGVTEEQVIISLACHGPLRIGSVAEARKVARALYSVG